MSQVEVDKIIPQSGTTLTIGDSGDTIAIASGATLSGSISGITNLTITGDLTVDTNTLKVDSANNRVGIGTSSPDTTLEIQSSGANGISLDQRLDFGGVSSNLFFKDTVGTFSLRSSDGGLTFNTGATVGSATGTERMRIDSSGNVGIGTTNLTSKFKVVGNADLIFSGAGTQEVLKLENSDTSAGTQAVKLSFQSNGFTKASIIGAVYGDGYMAFHTNNDTEKMRISASGHVIAPYGVTLGTAVGTYNASNTLDDYEEGTWTPSFSAGLAPSGTITSITGTYTKVGRIVTLSMRVDGTSLDAPSYMRVTGMPFSVSSNGTGTYIIGGINSRVHGWTLLAGITEWYWSPSGTVSGTTMNASVTYYTT